MDSEPGLMFLVKSIGYQTPTILVYLIGLLVAFVFIRRCPAPSMMTILAMIMLLGTLIGASITQAVVIRSSSQGGIDPQDMGRWLSVVGVGAGVIRAAALGLLVAAVFVGRSTRIVGKTS